jgi:hypothetical protein
MLISHFQQTGETLEFHGLGWDDLWKRKNDTKTAFNDKLEELQSAIEALNKLDSETLVDLNLIHLANLGWPDKDGSGALIDPYDKSQSYIKASMLTLLEKYKAREQGLRKGKHAKSEAQRAIIQKLADHWVLTNGTIPILKIFNNTSPNNDWSKAVFDMLHHFGESDGWSTVCKEVIDGLKANQSARFKGLLKIHQNHYANSAKLRNANNFKIP